MKNKNHSFGLCLLFPCLVAGQEDEPKSRDFSKTNSVTISLADSDVKGRLQGNGLEHAFWEADGVTVATNVQGVACRCLDMNEERQEQGLSLLCD